MKSNMKSKVTWIGIPSGTVTGELNMIVFMEIKWTTELGKPQQK